MANFQAGGPIRILVAEDHEVIREGLDALLSAIDGFDVVGGTADGLSTLRQISMLKPDVVLMDLSMPEMDGIAATRESKRRQPDVKIIALTAADNERRLADVMQAGADGCVLKKSGRDDLVEAIKTVHAGQSYFGKGISAHMVQSFASGSENIKTSMDILSGRERQVLQLIAEGSRNREVAEKLCISVKTVETHRMKIMQKLNLHSAAELATFAIREGLVSGKPAE